MTDVRISMGATALIGLFGCSSVSQTPGASGPLAASDVQPACDVDKDRRAILAMAGSYDVKFDFAETVALTKDYELRAPYRVGATELVTVAEDTPGRIVLQHILAMEHAGKRKPMKHWRQDWTFEAPDLVEYRGGQTWAKRALSRTERQCAWAQEVYGIEDAPRYGSWGRWVHQGGVATWTSQDTWRPLPRRESKREDYDVIVGVNRHTITPSGRVHEQDNGKLVLRQKNQLLARERGVIPYNRSSLDLSSIERDSRETAPFWQDVREGWREVVKRREVIAFLPASRNPGSLADDLEELREKAGSSPGQSDRRRLIGELIERYLEPKPQRTTTASRHDTR